VLKIADLNSGDNGNNDVMRLLLCFLDTDFRR
jgi:hypothetical protein